MSWINKHKYLYYPLIIIVLYFGLEKIFSSDYYKKLTMDDAPFLIFENKEKMFAQLPVVAAEIKDHNKHLDKNSYRKKGLLVLGTSRLLFMSYDYVKTNYPDWEFFNFSGPVTYPAYYLYILERVIEQGFVPDMIIVETAAFQYSDGTDAFLRSNMAYSFDLEFVLKHFNLFQRDEVSYFLARYLFSGYRYPPKWKNIKSRMGDPQQSRILQAFNAIDEFQKENRGSSRNIIPKDDWYQTDLASMDYQARFKTIPWLYANYKMSQRQFAFLEKLLVLSKQHGLNVVLVSPAVSDSLIQATTNYPGLGQDLANYKHRLESLRTKYNASFVDFNQHPNYKCNTFVDDAHMSMDCYNLMIDDLMARY